MQDKPITEKEELLKRSGLRNTKRRRAILSVLEQSRLPVTAQDVYIELKKRDVAVDMSTIYRTLEIMSDKQIIKKLGIVGEERAYYELLKVVHRHFLVCIGCKKITPVSGCPLGEYEETLERETNYKISGHRLDIYGYCPDCRRD